MADRPRRWSAAGLAGAVGLALAGWLSAAQPDLGPRRPDDPPPTRYAVDRIGDRVAADLQSLERARRAAIGDTRDAVDAAIALRHVLAELAGVGTPDERPEDGDLVLAAAITADLTAWDAVLRQAIDDPAMAEHTRAVTQMMDEMAPPRARLAAGARQLAVALGMEVEAAAEAEAEPAAPGRDGGEVIDAGSAGARLDAAIARAGWLGGTDELLRPHRRGAVGPGGAPVLVRAAEVIDAITDIRPQARRRARLRQAVDRLAEVWPADADPRSLAEVDRGWRRLGGMVEVAARRRAIAGRVAPAGLSLELRRLTGLLVERAEAAELEAIDRVDELLLGAGPMRDPALVSIVIGFRQAVENLDRLHVRSDWLDAVAAIDDSLRPVAATWIDEWLLRLGAPAQRAQAARRLKDFEVLLDELHRPPGLARMEDPAPADRALVGNRTREIVEAFSRARRERLSLAFGGEAAPAAGAIGRWLDLLAMIDVVGRARDHLADGGASAAATVPDWFVVVPAETLVAEAARAIDVAVDRALDGRDAGGPPTDAVALARSRVAVAAAWVAAVERGRETGTPASRPAAVPETMIAALGASTAPALAELSAHAVESAAARLAGDEDAADAHRAMAVWIAATDFDPTTRPAPSR